jgi:hypothetical protein
MSRAGDRLGPVLLVLALAAAAAAVTGATNACPANSFDSHNHASDKINGIKTSFDDHDQNGRRVKETYTLTGEPAPFVIETRYDLGGRIKGRTYFSGHGRPGRDRHDCRAVDLRSRRPPPRHPRPHHQPQLQRPRPDAARRLPERGRITVTVS